jgi:hypothetical protein
MPWTIEKKSTFTATLIQKTIKVKTHNEHNCQGKGDKLNMEFISFFLFKTQQREVIPLVANLIA